MQNTEHIAKFEETLTQSLLAQCTSQGFLRERKLLEVEELQEKWRSSVAPEYMVDAVRELNVYPAATIAWAAYVGMALAAMWDGAWDQYVDKADLYQAIREPRGFDALDEYVCEEFLGLDLDSSNCRSLGELLNSCAHTAMALMRNEQVEPQSTDAFYIFAATASVFFRLGVSLELQELGYEYKRIVLSDLAQSTTS